MEISASPAAPPGLSIGLCVPSSSSPPVQLELLPLYPTPHPPSPCSPSLPWQRACMSSRGIIDVNQIPSTPDCYETVSFFSNVFKRERDQKLSDSDYEREKAYEVTSRVGSDEDEAGQPRKKLRLSKEQSALLEESFKEHSTLNPKQKNTLAKQLSLRPRQVEVWFQNRRARTKLKQTEVDCELLKRWCESLTEENRRLQKELQELKAIRVASPCVITHDLYMPLPAATLSMCPSCQRLSTPENRSLPLFSNPNNKSQLFPQPSAAG